MKFWSNTPRHIAEYLCLRAVAGLVSVLPYRLALTVGWGLAALGFFVFRWRRAEACRRIREVFGDRYTDRQVRSIAWLSLRNFLFNVVDGIRLPGITHAWVLRHMRCDGLEKIKADLAGKGAILVVPHMGSWDLAGIATHLRGIPVFFIVGSQKNPLADAYINRMRGSSGVETIPRDSSALRGAVRNLRAGKVLAFMTDLRSKTPGVAVRFLGKEANLVAGMGLFARMADVPIYPIILRREGWTLHPWTFHDPILPDPAADRDADILRTTQTVIRLFEEAIRETPDQYFWYNKRWVLEPLPPPSA